MTCGTIRPEWVTAGSTVVLALVAFVAIFGDEIKKYIWHPEWKVNFQASRPDCNRIRVDFGRLDQTKAMATAVNDSAQTHYIRARVENMGKVGATDIEVTVTEVRSRGADHKFHAIQMGTPWDLTWAHLPSEVLSRLPVGGQRHIDIGHVVDPHKRSLMLGEDRPDSNHAATLFCLAFFVKSNTGEYLLDPGEYEIDFRVFAGNAKPSVTFTFHLNHTGQWFEDETQMYTAGLGLSVTSAFSAE